MKNKAVYIALFLIGLFANAAISQDRDIPFDKRLFEDDKEGFENASKEIKLGDFYFFDGRDELLASALVHYLVAQDFNPYSSILNYKIGVCYLYSENKFKSLYHLEFAYKVYPDLDVNLKLYLAQAYQLTGNFPSAIKFYKNYQNTIPVSDKEQHLFVSKKIEECNTGIELTNEPERVWVDNLGDSINSEFAEFSPVISADNRVLFYTAKRPDSKGQKKDKSGHYYEDIYYSVRDTNGTWSAAKNIGSPVNTELHDATIGVAPDGKSILTYQGISAKNGDILITKQLQDGSWEKPHSIGIGINSKHHESSATLSFDEKTLFFVSDQPGGYGKHDIYVSNWDENKQEWGLGENIGSKINTSFEELSVFFHADSKTLYFSSDGHRNMGGLDIFKSTYDPVLGDWSEPENLGYPINTPDDDTYFVVTGNGRHAYYSSSRPGGNGEKDIYQITFLGSKKPAELPEKIHQTAPVTNTNSTFLELEKTTPQFLLTGRIIDGNTQLGIKADLYVVNALSKEKVNLITSKTDGSYAIVLTPGEHYALTVAGSAYTITSNTLITDASFLNQEKELNFIMYPPSADSTEGLNAFALRNIYFDFDEADLSHTAFDSHGQLELDLLVNFLIENPTIIIELGGHTDRRGATLYNQELSESRAKIAKQYLISKGIAEERIKTVGYGESEPEVSWEIIKEMKDKDEREEAHQRNRRTVVKILSK